MQFNRAALIEQALQKLEQKFPQFRNPNHRPNAKEAEAHREHQLLKRAFDGALLQDVVEEYLLRPKAQVDREGEEVERILVRMGLASVPLAPALQTDTVAAIESSPKQSRKVQRGLFSERIIQETKILYKQLWKKADRPPNFEILRERFPDLFVLKLLNGKPFDDDDRDLVMSPTRWGVKPPTYALGILKRVFEVSEHAIKSYRSAYRSYLKSKRS